MQTSRFPAENEALLKNSEHCCLDKHKVADGVASNDYVATITYCDPRSVRLTKS